MELLSVASVQISEVISYFEVSQLKCMQYSQPYAASYASQLTFLNLGIVMILALSEE
jgi:hypothetical protein